VWPREAFDRISFGAMERVHRSRHGSTYVGWQWWVRLHASAQSAPLSFGDSFVPDMVEFQPCVQKDRPSPTGRPPQPVYELLRWLQSVTAAQTAGPDFAEYQRAGTGRGTVRRFGPVTTRTNVQT